MGFLSKTKLEVKEEEAEDAVDATPAYDPALPYDPTLLDKDQPLVRVIFDKEVVYKGQLLQPGVEYDVVAPFAHSMSAHIAPMLELEEV